jgi:hypothetical protein
VTQSTATATVGAKGQSASEQERPPIPIDPPRRFRRVARRGKSWGLSRTMAGYTVAADVGIGGKAPKWVLAHNSKKEDFYIAKLGSKNGRAETLTELFNNQLGQELGFEMAHSGLARLDGSLYFITRNFRSADERLVHGSLMIEEVFGTTRETERINPRLEQSFYSIDFLKEVIDHFCKADAASVFVKFVEMLIFDALIGSMDRHAQNWGVLQRTSLPERFRFSPIYDSARALLWSLPERKLLRYHQDGSLLSKYIDGSKPCIGPARNHPKVNNCSHFDVVQNLLDLYPHQTVAALSRIPADIETKAGKLLKQFPFDRLLSPLRRRLILKVLKQRADKLQQLLQGVQV